MYIKRGCKQFRSISRPGDPNFICTVLLGLPSFGTIYFPATECKHPSKLTFVYILWQSTFTNIQTPF